MPFGSELFLAMVVISFVAFGLALAYGSMVAPGKTKR